MDRIGDFFGASFMPHGHCYFWRPEILWLHAGSDALIALAYFAIPAYLFYFIRRRRDVVSFRWIFHMFAAFIVMCGLTHLFGVYNVWNAEYGLEGIVKLLTAGISVATAVALQPLVPRLLSLPSPGALEAVNAGLTREVEQREAVERELRRVHAELEHRVQERTAELEQANAALVREVAERERSERLLEAQNRGLDDFASIVSHDLKAPLRGISALASWIAEDESSRLSDRSQEHLRLLRGRARKLGERVDGILSFARLTRPAVDREPVDAGEVVEEVLDLLDPPEGVPVRIAGELPVVVYERTQLAQVLQNLIQNAVEHVETPGGRVEISARDLGPAWELRVRDDGEGFDPRHAQRVFGVFQSLEADAERRGTGLGLAIVKRIVELHGGSVSVDTAPGRGATFAFTVPKNGSAPG